MKGVILRNASGKFSHFFKHEDFFNLILDAATISICVVLMILLIVVCCFALRPRRIIFKRVLIEKSPLYATPNIDIAYEPPKVTVVNEEKLPFTVYLRKFFQREEFRGFSNLDETISGELNKFDYHITNIQSQVPA